MALPVSVYSATQVRALDAYAIKQLHVPGYTLMKRAGEAALRYLRQRWPTCHRIAIVCGGGNNGGDGRVCARVLRERGREVTLIDGFGDLGEPDVIVDALLGIGLNDAPREDVARMIEIVNASGKPVVAIDVPSGVNASTGEVPGAAIRASTTVTFGQVKVGLAVAPGRFHAGAVQLVDIGLDPAENEHALLTAAVLDRVPRKTATSTKYRAGSVLVVGGSRGLTGAPILAALGAFRADAGYVTLAVPESALAAVEAHVLEAVKRPLPEDSGGRLLPRTADAILEAAERAQAVVIGPGLGRSDGTRDLVLTLHAGELAHLLETEPGEVDAHRLEAVRRAAGRFASTVLLKGADTLVASPRSRVLVASYGTPALASAGTGDVLAGVVGSFLAKGLEPPLAAGAAAVAHGLASRFAPQSGLMASDLLEGLRRALDGEGRDLPPLP
jgi:NAD(P)H-hydrate epimerase